MEKHSEEEVTSIEQNQVSKQLLFSLKFATLLDDVI